ncbi:TPA: MerC domain-containing protein [Legionella pneumophila]
MKEFMTLIKTWVSFIIAGIAAACCLGIPVVIAAVTALGLGFLIRDAYLFPIFVGAIAISIKVLFTSSQRHQNMLPFWVGLMGGLLAVAALWLLITRLFSMVWAIYLGLILLVIASIWDFINGRFQICETDVVCEIPIGSRKLKITGRHIAKAIGIVVTVAMILYGLFKSI